MKQIARLLSAFLLAVIVSPALAADPVYPPGVRIGMVPLVGLASARSFTGFETEDHTVRVLVTELPAAAYSEVENTFKAGVPTNAGVKPETLETTAGKAYYTVETGRDGTTPVRRYSMILSGGTFSGFVAMQVPENAARIYSDDAVRQMFASAAIRKDVPVAEQLGLLPFKTSELSDFKTVRTLAPGAAVMLADGNEESGIETAPFMVLGLVASAPDKPDDRARFAQQTAGLIPGLRDSKVTVSEPIRIDGAPGYETRIDAVTGKDNTPVTVVQWLRFGAGNTAIRVIGSAPRDEWAKAFPRFRAVRDGIQTRAP
ncbi:MAG: hypothetical protein BGP05_03415 [Rhizobiales bacterium 62-47]|nr:hypothetical protein [Hyphomicrobiales bacterium]OJY12976.1 MAG: hypothetical protein BGP05_03415 [Rhizobiales bacterium 62-47]